MKWLQSTSPAWGGAYRTNSDNPASWTTGGSASYPQHGGANAKWRIGQNVMHAKFGTGVIINREGSGSEARVQVNFAQSGTKWLLLEYAKLTEI